MTNDVTIDRKPSDGRSMGASTCFRWTFPFVTAAMEQWRETVNNSREPVLSLRSNSDHELEVLNSILTLALNSNM